MDVTLGIVVIGAVVVVSLLGAWAAGRNRRDKAHETDSGKSPPEELTAAEDLKKLKDEGRYGGLV